MTSMKNAPIERDAIDYDAIADPGHGNTVAAWTGVAIMLLGSIIAGVGNVIFNDFLFYGGIAVAAVGLLVGFILRLMGFGAKGKRSKGH